MNRLLMAAVIGLGFLRANAGAATSYGGGVHYYDLDKQGSLGQVFEYNGKVYGRPWGDAWVSAENSKGLLDLEVRDVGSTEESGSFYVDRGASFKGSAMFDRMTHRQNLTEYGIVLDGVYTKMDGTLTRNRREADKNYQFKRTESEVNLEFYDPSNSARWLTAQYWGVLKKGDAPGAYSSGGLVQFDQVHVDNLTNELTLGLGTSLARQGAMSLDLSYREFRDYSMVMKWGTGVTNQIRPTYPHSELAAAEMRFRYELGKKLAMTAALTGRERKNLFSNFKTNAAVAAFNAAYSATKKLSLTMRLYSRYIETTENTSYRNWSSYAPATQFDRLQLRGEWSANYRPVERVRVKAAYKAELNHRRDAPSEVFSSTAGFTDGTFVPAYAHENRVAGDETKHLATVGADVALPFGIDLGVDYRRLQANRGTFVNTPTRGDYAAATLYVPLPANIGLMLMADYLAERNSEAMTNYHQFRNAYRAALDWQASRRVMVGLDGSYEAARYFTEGWFGFSGGEPPSGLVHVHGMNNRQYNTTGGAHARVKCPKGFVVGGNGSYTQSLVQTPLRVNPVNDAGRFVGDMTPSEARIARGAVVVEYTPPKASFLTARAGYRVDHWVDKNDPTLSGRASVAHVGASAKF